MRGVVREFNVYRWAGRMLLDAAVDAPARRFARTSAEGEPGRRMNDVAPQRIGASREARAPRPRRRRRRSTRGLRAVPRHRRHAARARADARWRAASTRSSRALLPRVAAQLGGALALITGRSIGGRRSPVPGPAPADRRPARLRAARGRRHRCTCMPRMPAALRSCARALQALSRRGTPASCSRTRAPRSRCTTAQAPQLASHVHRVAARAVARRGGEHGRPAAGQSACSKCKPDGRDKGTAIVEFMARAAVRRTPAGVRRRRHDRRVRLRGRRPHGRMVGQGRAGATHAPAIACRTSPPCAAGSPAPLSATPSTSGGAS